jgi:hypothetical protein
VVYGCAPEAPRNGLSGEFALLSDSLSGVATWRGVARKAVLLEEGSVAEGEALLLKELLA